MKTTNVKKALCLGYIFIIFLLFMSAFGGMTSAAVAAADANASNAFDTTNVLADLRSSTTNGKAFNVKDYPYDDNGNIELISFIEYCYSPRVTARGNYGLYVYIYNPTGLNIATGAGSNKIQMAIGSDNYEKYGLKFCSVSSGDYDKLFYKFKVIERADAEGKTFAQRVNSNERCYDVSGFELITYGATNAEEYGVGGSFKFTGFAAGYGADADSPSTLNCTVTDLETIKLNVKHTFYRTGVSDLGRGYQNEVNTAYFTLDKSILEKYGNLQRIKAEWYEYRTAPIYVTNDLTAYDILSKQKGKRLTRNPSAKGSLFNASVPCRIYGINPNTVKFGYNFDSHQGLPFVDQIPFIYYLSDVNRDSVFNFLKTPLIVDGISSTQLAQDIYSYDKSYYAGTLPIKNNTISADLFDKNVDAGRTRGYNIHDVDLGDTFNLKSYLSNHSWWDKMFNFGIKSPDLTEEHIDVPPIYELTDNDVKLNNDLMARNLLINPNDTDAIKKLYNDLKSEESVFLFRFANTQYLSDEAEIYCPSSQYASLLGFVSDHAYVAQETVFFDFDILQLTFNKEGVYRVIPIVSSPIDIINPITAPITNTDSHLPDWLIYLLYAIAGIIGLLLLIIIVVLIAPVLPYIVSGIGHIIAAPFKAISRSVKDYREKHSKKPKPPKAKKKKPKKKRNTK